MCVSKTNKNMVKSLKIQSRLILNQNTNLSTEARVLFNLIIYVTVVLLLEVASVIYLNYRFVLFDDGMITHVLFETYCLVKWP